MRLLLLIAAGFAASLLPLGGCAQERPASAVAPAHVSRGGVHNIHRINDRIISGSGPATAADFEQLERLGIRTIISVDGGRPSVELAEARGMRYVHIPVTYATITPAQRLEIARAVRDLPGPVFVHCHHGKHRGPAAAAGAAVTLGVLSPEDATAFMRTAGTAEHYSGLYSCVAGSSVATDSQLDSAPSDFPAVRRVEGLVAAMVEIDLALEHLDHIRAAGWTVPADHPDLVPAAEAGRLADHFRTSVEDDAITSRGPGFVKLLLESARIAGSLEESIIADRPATELDAHFKRVQASCKECHSGYRDHR